MRTIDHARRAQAIARREVAELVERFVVQGHGAHYIDRGPLAQQAGSTPDARRSVLPSVRSLSDAEPREQLVEHTLTDLHAAQLGKRAHGIA